MEYVRMWQLRYKVHYIESEHKRMAEKRREIKKAILLAAMCMFSYLGCYMARNVLSVVSPQMIETGLFSVEIIGMLSTGYMICYGIGQFVNGVLGDVVKGKYMIGAGLLCAGICNICIPFLNSMLLTVIVYSLTGCFLSMVYAPLMKMLAENTHPVYASRCSLAFSVAFYLGTPIASLLAVVFQWKMAFVVGGVILIIMGSFCFMVYTVFEKRGIIKYTKGDILKGLRFDVSELLKLGIIKITVVSILTGIVRTSVVFWVPTYLSRYLGLSDGLAASVFAIINLAVSIAAPISMILLYDLLLKRNMNGMLIVMFGFGVVSFLMMFIVSNPFVNILFLALALFCAEGGSTMVFCVYCPSLGKTGMVSTVTGFLDSMSYLGAAIANAMFANIVVRIGWKNLILVWRFFMVIGVVISFIKRRENI